MKKLIAWLRKLFWKNYKPDDLNATLLAMALEIIHIGMQQRDELIASKKAKEIIERVDNETLYKLLLFFDLLSTDTKKELIEKASKIIDQIAKK
ncbi:MAG: hypothetical protein QXP36_08055 [Conexivisphaerales archaeon]